VTSLRGMPTLEPQAVGVTHVDSWENHGTKQGIVKPRFITGEDIILRVAQLINIDMLI
jgi:hypothetical protein